jgi:hypothetical protein
VCALGVSAALTAGAVSAAPGLAPPAISHVYVSDVALTASASPVASGGNYDLEVLRDRLDRAVRSGLSLLALPVTFPIAMLGLVEGFACIYSGCVPRLLNFSAELGKFFRPPAVTPVDSDAWEQSELRWDRLDRAIRAGLFVVSSPVVVPTLVVARAGISVIAASPGFLYDRGIVDFYNALVSVNNVLVTFFFPPTAGAASVVANREVSSAPPASAAVSEPRNSIAASRRAHPTLVLPAAKHQANAASRPDPKKVDAKAASERRSSGAHSARSASQSSLSR